MALHNTYWLIRHGHSKANAKDIIISELANGIQPIWGLSDDVGKIQADGAGQLLKTNLEKAGVDLSPTQPGNPSASPIIVCTSPFSRCVETAERIAGPLGIKPGDENFMQLENLKERYFGEHEMQIATDRYEQVWADDAKSIHNKPPGDGESVMDTSLRMHSVIQQLEEQFTNKTIIIVSHGDSLSILTATLLGTDLSKHREHGLPNCGALCISNTTT